MKRLLSFGPVFIVIAALLWSLDGLLRISLYVLPPITIVFYEHLLGFLLLLPLLLFSSQVKHLGEITKRTWGAFFWITLLSSVLGTLFYTAALGQINFIQFSVVVLLQKLQPIFAVFFGWFILKEKLTKHFFWWFALALIAAYFVAFPTGTINLSTGQGTVIAALLAIGAAFCWGSSTAFSRYALLQLPILLTTGIRFGLAAVIALFLVFVLSAQESLTTINVNQWLMLLVITLSTGMVALLIYYYGLKKTPVKIATICELVWPLSAVVIDYVYFHRTLTTTQIIGSIMLLYTIYKVSLLSKSTLTDGRRD